MSEGNATASKAMGGGQHHRHATVLFSDLTGYTTLVAGHRDRLAVVARITNLLEQVAQRVITKHRGIVNEVRGDGVVGVFGLPSNDEFDVRDAIEAALELHSTMRALTATASPADGGALDMHSGIHSGLVYVDRGTDDKRIYRITGEAPILAVRFSDLAEAGQVIVSASAVEGVRAYFETQSLGRRTFEKFPEPIAIEAVLGHSGLRHRFDVSVRRGLSLFIGRREALSQLQASLDAVLAGERRLVGLVGIGGVGKTRLAEEFLSRSYADDVRVLRGYCTGTEQAPPLEPFLHILSEVLGLVPHAATSASVEATGRDDGETRGRLATAVLAELPELGSHVDMLLRILSVNRPERTMVPPDQPSGSAMVDALIALFGALAKRRPLVLFLDDWQWADEASGQVVARLTGGSFAAPILMVVASRDRKLGPGIRRADATIELGGLAPADAGEVVRRLLPGHPDLGVVERIYRRTGGIPLYIEEFCRADPGVSFDEVAQVLDEPGEGTPHWLSRIIEARFEHLSERARHVVSVASVVGRVIPEGLLARVVADAPPGSALEELAAADLLFADGAEHSYSFKHGVTRDVIYELVEFDERVRLHLVTARALETEADRIEEHLEALAYHYRRAEQFAKAVDYAERAADKARVRASLDGARAHYQAALEALDRLPPSPRIDARRTSISRNWALVCMYTPAAAQIERFKQQISHAEKTFDEEGAARAQYFVGYLNYTLGRHRDAQAYFELAGAAAERLGMINLQAEVLGGLGHSRSACGQNRAALGYLDASLRIWEEHPSPRGLPVGHAYTLTCKGMVIADMGDFARGHVLIDRALQMLGGVNHQIVGSILCFQGATLLWQGEWAQGYRAAESARMIGQRVSGPFIFATASAIGAYARTIIDRSPEHVEALRRAIEWIEGWDIGLYLSLLYGYLVDALASTGRVDEAAMYFERSREARSVEGDMLGTALGARALARAAAQSPGTRLPAPEHYLAIAREIAELRASPVEAACNAACEAEVMAAAGLPGAAERAAFARSEFMRLGMTGHIDALAQPKTTAQSS